MEFGGAAASIAATCFCRSACSEMRSSSSICVRNSFEARRKSRHQLAELARQLRQLLRPEEQQSEDYDECAVAKTRHRCAYDTA